MNEAIDASMGAAGSCGLDVGEPRSPATTGGAKHGVVVAARFWDRLVGFLRPRPPNCVLLIAPCRSIHTFGMTGLLDVAFFDRCGRVVRVHRAVGPRRRVGCCGAYGVLERGARDDVQWYREGDEVTVCIDD